MRTLLWDLLVDDEHIDALARVAPVSPHDVRQPQSKANAGSFTNGMADDIGLGCGIWGGNITNENISLKHYLNVTLGSAGRLPKTARQSRSSSESSTEPHSSRDRDGPHQFSLAYLTVFDPRHAG